MQDALGAARAMRLAATKRRAPGIEIVDWSNRRDAFAPGVLTFHVGQPAQITSTRAVGLFQPVGSENHRDHRETKPLGLGALGVLGG